MKPCPPVLYTLVEEDCRVPTWMLRKALHSERPVVRPAWADECDSEYVAEDERGEAIGYGDSALQAAENAIEWIAGKKKQGSLLP